MRNIIIFFILVLLASCQKTVTQSYTPNPKDYTGSWEYEVWINDTTEENKFFGMVLQNIGNDSIKGIFYSAWQNGNIYDGSDTFIGLSPSSLEDESITDEDSNVLGKFVNDSLYVTLKGGYCENASAKAVMYLENDSSLLWKLVSKDGEIYVPDSVILKREYEIEEIQDSITEPADSSPVKLKGKLSEYSVKGSENGEYEYEKPLGEISLMKNGEIISNIDLPGYEPNSNFSFWGIKATDNGFSFNITYGHTHLYYEQIFVIEYISNDFYLVKTIDYTPNTLVPYGKQRKSENKLKEPIPFSKLNIEKMMLTYSEISEDE